MEVELINADVPGGRIVLSDLPALIGRSQTADVCLNDPGVAEFQCMIVQDGDKLAVIDNVEDGSTFVNGARAISRSRCRATTYEWARAIFWCSSGARSRPTSALKVNLISPIVSPKTRRQT